MKRQLSRRRFSQLTALTALSGAGLSRQALAAEATEATLPDLPYGYDALAPHIDERTMRIHHGKHHAGYVAKLNAALSDHADLAAHDLDTLMGSVSKIEDGALQTAVRNNGGGHWNHRFFWESMSPAAQQTTTGADLATALKGSFGSLDGFKETFAKAAGSRFGSGWAWLIVQDGKLKVVSTPNQDNPLMTGIVPDDSLGTPILGLDVWEHAYYLHYQNRRGAYVEAWWNVVNWEAATKRFAAAMG
jgi:Fe-Mn family superoxide dismutase